MKRCFCGCGRTVPRFPLGLRSINRRGAQVKTRLEETEAKLGADFEPLASFYADGRALVGALRDAMHGERDPLSLDEGVVRAWQRDARALERQTAAVEHAAREAGLSPDETVRRLAQNDRFR